MRPVASYVMDASSRDWLLSCPAVQHVSMLAIDAARAGMLDLPSAMADAIARSARLIALGVKRRTRPTSKLHEDKYWLPSRSWCFLDIVQDTVVLKGSLGQGVTISGTPWSAKVHIPQQMPEAVIASLPGEALSRIFSARGLPLDKYVVTDAEQDVSGFTVSFDVPRYSKGYALEA